VVHRDVAALGQGDHLVPLGLAHRGEPEQPPQLLQPQVGVIVEHPHQARGLPVDDQHLQLTQVRP
jgi:hypothetical protein